MRGRTTDFAAFSQPLVDRVRGEPRIRFEGAFARDELGAALAAIDVLLVPSRWYENTPFVVLEAFAAGVPVLASALGGLTELVEDGVHGELFSPGDADDLARRLVRLREEPQRLAEYRARLPRVKTLSDNVDEIESLYGALWSGERSPSTMPPPV